MVSLQTAKKINPFAGVLTPEIQSDFFSSMYELKVFVEVINIVINLTNVENNTYVFLMGAKYEAIFEKRNVSIFLESNLVIFKDPHFNIIRYG